MKKKITQLNKLFSVGALCGLMSVSSLSAQTNITIEAEAPEGAHFYAQVSNTLEGFSGQAGLVELKSYYGSRAQYELDVPTAGTYDLAIHYATMNIRHTYVKINDQIPQVVKFDALTGSWNGEPGDVENEEGEMESRPGIEVKTIQIYLEAGENLLEIGAFEAFSESEDALYGEAPNIDKFVITNSASAISKPADQIETIKLLASTADKLNGNAKVGSNMIVFEDGKGVVDMRSSDKSYFQFNSVNIEEAGTYDVAVYYATMNGRYGYLKVNNQQKQILHFNKTTPSWGSDLHDDPLKPGVSKKVAQIYFDKGSNTLQFGAYGGWSPNIDRIEITKSGVSIEKPGQDILSYIFDFTDHLGVEFKESTATDSENLKKLFDNDEYTYYELKGASSATIEVKTTYPIILTAYGVATSYENPVNTEEWLVEYSLDGGKTWSTVLKGSNALSANYNLINTQYSPLDETPVAAQYYRLTAKGTTDVVIGEWQLFGVPFISEEVNFPENELTNALNLTASEDGFNRGGTWNEVYENAIDLNATTKYTVVDKQEFDLTYEFEGDAVEVKSYAITVPYEPSMMERNPSKWTLLGFSDEIGDWVTLHEVNGIEFASAASTLAFDLEDPTPCLAYMLSVKSTTGGSTAHMLQWQMFNEFKIKTADEVGIDEDQSSNEANITIVGKEGAIVIYSELDNVNYSIYNLAGQMVANGVCNIGNTERLLPAGFYIVKAGEVVEKLIIK